MGRIEEIKQRWWYEGLSLIHPLLYIYEYEYAAHWLRLLRGWEQVEMLKINIGGVCSLYCLAQPVKEYNENVHPWQYKLIRKLHCWKVGRWSQALYLDLHLICREDYEVTDRNVFYPYFVVTL